MSSQPELSMGSHLVIGVEGHVVILDVPMFITHHPDFGLRWMAVQTSIL